MGVIILGPASVVPKNYLMRIADSLDVELVKMVGSCTLWGDNRNSRSGGVWGSVGRQGRRRMDAREN